MAEGKKKEVRCVKSLVTRAAGEDSRRIEGYAALYDTPSDGLCGFTEVIAKGAFDGVLERSNVFALLNHDPSRGILARWDGEEVSLRLELDEKGLKYSFDAPNHQLGNELLEYIKRGEMTSSSFAFTVEEDDVSEGSDGEILRTIRKIDKLYDVSPVFDAAYSSTTVDKRSIEAFEDSKKQSANKKEEEEKSKRKKESDDYFEAFENEYSYLN